jgi:iron complex transport system permease protein
VVVVDIRLSRACLAWLTGAALAMAGTVFQGILHNPLADPFTIGVSTGAAFGASLALFFGLAALPVWAGVGLLPVAAMAGAFAALGAVIALGRVGGRLRRETVVLAGIGVATFLARSSRCSRPWTRSPWPASSSGSWARCRGAAGPTWASPCRIS